MVGKTKVMRARLLSAEGAEDLRKFLLEHEYDIYSGFYNFASLQNLFKEMFERDAEVNDVRR